MKAIWIHMPGMLLTCAAMMFGNGLLAAEPTTIEITKYTVWSSYTSGQQPTPGTSFDSQADAEESAQNLRGLRGNNNEQLYFNVSVRKEKYFKTIFPPGISNSPQDVDLPRPGDLPTLNAAAADNKSAAPKQAEALNAAQGQLNSAAATYNANAQKLLSDRNAYQSQVEVYNNVVSWRKQGKTLDQGLADLKKSGQRLGVINDRGSYYRFYDAKTGELKASVVKGDYAVIERRRADLEQKSTRARDAAKGISKLYDRAKDQYQMAVDTRNDANTLDQIVSRVRARQEAPAITQPETEAGDPNGKWDLFTGFYSSSGSLARTYDSKAEAEAAGEEFVRANPTKQPKYFVKPAGTYKPRRNYD